ncbi:macrolide transporter subunit MacA [Xenorhabdus sp. 12]|uniref:Macrolide transporter subunit MacA n=1 Tax=Xenorhabdus santafensis TaxID=2582833 RepID=A0ABU4S9V0_9GAMM|nr:macrolide transporter subunit MacA [Xenorhabdus sp. 12]MDX7987557.1 macrolide transporter subunit MacA [Xenorhabdus sp. 12]
MKFFNAKRLWVFAVLILLIVASVFISSYYFPKAITYQTSVVMKGNLKQSVLATGTLDAVSKVDVGAQISGQLKELYVKLGDKVKKGQLLAMIDPQTAKNDVKEKEETVKGLQFDLQGAEAELRFSRLEVSRKSKLIKSNLISQYDLDNAVKSADSAFAKVNSFKAQIRKSQATLNNAKTKLQYTSITAPIAGVVTNIKTLQGQTVNAAQEVPTILTLANLDTMIVNAEISEADIVKLKPGQKVSFTILGAPEKHFSSHLLDILPAPPAADKDKNNSNDNAIFYYARFEVPNEGHILRLKMTAQVNIEVQSLHNVLMIPISALEKLVSPNQYEVSVLQNGKKEKRIITTGIFNDINVQVISGLKENEHVITGSSDQNNSGAL